MNKEDIKYFCSDIRHKLFFNPFELKPIIERRHKRGETIVFGNGCFDILHVGHARYLYAAKSLGDALIVAVNTDDSMARIKPDRKPVTPDYERLEMIASFGAVDYVVPMEQNDPCFLIDLYKPNIHTKGPDYKGRVFPEIPVVESYGGRIEFVGDPKNHSTTQVLHTIRNSG
ncbi:MAG: adenylyltransferase/cytidyltransferase family protein [Nanoarchaeota archaeon]